MGLIWIHEAPLLNLQKQGMPAPMPIQRIADAGTENCPVEGITMPSCGTCHRNLVPASPAPLFEIRHGYRSEWNGLAFSVESNSGDWMLRVGEVAKMETLYTARRAQAHAAQLMAAEFAAFRLPGGDQWISPDRLAKELKWQEYW
jgi:hypothetical protein